MLLTDVDSSARETMDSTLRKILLTLLKTLGLLMLLFPIHAAAGCGA